jgi:hypothetical protein
MNLYNKYPINKKIREVAMEVTGSTTNNPIKITTKRARSATHTIMFANTCMTSLSTPVVTA